MGCWGWKEDRGWWLRFALVCNVRPFRHILFTLPPGVIGRLCSMIVAFLVHLY